MNEITSSLSASNRTRSLVQNPTRFPFPLGFQVPLSSLPSVKIRDKTELAHGERCLTRYRDDQNLHKREPTGPCIVISYGSLGSCGKKRSPPRGSPFGRPSEYCMRDRDRKGSVGSGFGDPYPVLFPRPPSTSASVDTQARKLRRHISSLPVMRAQCPTFK